MVETTVHFLQSKVVDYLSLDRPLNLTCRRQRRLVFWFKPSNDTTCNGSTKKTTGISVPRVVAALVDTARPDVNGVNVCNLHIYAFLFVLQCNHYGSANDGGQQEKASFVG